MTIFKSLYAFFMLSCLLTLVACSGGGGGGGDGGGGDSGSTPPPAAVQTLSGTAAAGAPIIGSVFVKDSAGVMRSTPIAADGSYTVDVSDMTPPFLMRAEGTVGGRSYTVHSAATSADINGNINITPLTDLIVANVARQVAANYFDSGNFSGLTAAELNAAENTLQQRLQDVLTDLGVAGSIDLIRTAFSANHQELDAALDVLRVTVDTATNTALITNVINNANITDDLALSSDTDLLDSTGTVTGLTDWEAILARMASLEAAFATGLPAADDPLLRAQFDQTGFLDDGDNLDTFLGELTSDPEMVGIQFASVSLVSLTSATNTDNGRAEIVLSIGDDTYGYDYIDVVMTGIFDGATGGTDWVIAGNQRIIEVGGETRSILGYNWLDPTQIQSGIDFDINADPAGNVDYAVVTGPGLPTSGGGANGSSAGVLMAMQPLFGGSFWIVPSPYTGPIPSTSFDPTTAIHPRARNHFPMYAMTDIEIAALPSDNLTYTVRIYDDNNTPTDLTDDGLLATYQFTLPKPPLPAGGLSAASFPVITSPTSADAMAILNTGGPLIATWNLPAGLAAEGFDVERYVGGDFYDDIDADIAPTSASATVQLTPPTGTVTTGILDTVAADFYNRNYSYRLWMWMQ